MREDNGDGKSLSPRRKRVPSRNTDVIKKPSEHLPPLKEKVRKIWSRKVGKSMKRLLEGIDRVRKLMVARQKSTPIRTQCDAVVASSSGGVCHDPHDTLADRDPSRKPAAYARGQTAQKWPAGKGAGVQAGSRQRVRRFSCYKKL